MSVENEASRQIRRLTKKLGDLPTAAVTWFFSDTASLYDVLGTQPGTGNYLNLGWWEGSRSVGDPVDEETIHSACEELVRQFARFGDLEPDDRILDVGFGFGQQDVLLAEEFGCRDITGINITPHHVRSGQEIVRDHGLEDQITLQEGDAVDLTFDADTFDKVFALETAFHFRTREDFFAEAHRVLRAGGTLLTADIIDGPQRENSSPIYSYLARAHEAYWNIPPENRIDRREYRQSLANHGFRNIEVRNVNDHVLHPWVRNYLPWRLNRQPVPLRWIGDPLLKLLLTFYGEDFFEYIFARAEC